MNGRGLNGCIAEWMHFMSRETIKVLRCIKDASKHKRRRREREDDFVLSKHAIEFLLFCCMMDYLFNESINGMLKKTTQSIEIRLNNLCAATAAVRWKGEGKRRRW